jgi:hypothetical protein
MLQNQGVVDGEFPYQPDSNRPMNSVPNLVARSGLLADTEINSPFWPKTVPTFDDGGTHGPNAAHANYTISNYVRLVNGTVSLPAVDNKDSNAQTIRNTNMLHMPTGTLVFGFRGPQLRGVGSSRPMSDLRLSVLDINIALLEDLSNRVSGGTLPEHECVQAFTHPDWFIQSFFFAGTVLLEDTQAGTLSSNSLQAASEDTATLDGHWTNVIDEVQKGVATVLNIWGNSTITITNGTKLYLCLRWIPVEIDETKPPGIPDDPFDLVVLGTVLVDIDETENNGIRWVLQLVPVATIDDRKPFWAEESSHGRGTLFFVGTVTNNPSNRRTSKPPQLANMYRRLSSPRSGNRVTPEEQEMCGFLQVAINTGVFRN